MCRIMGRELAGTIVASRSQDFKVGENVFGLTETGAWAEFAIMNTKDVYKFQPKTNFSMKVAAGFELNYGTSWHAVVRQGLLKRGETILILGASGGVGLAAIEYVSKIEHI
jgi:NADPH2:quinone reductase